jgi:hypothetical protein
MLGLPAGRAVPKKSLPPLLEMAIPAFFSGELDWSL